MDISTDNQPLLIKNLASLNERKMFNNDNISEFDVLRNAIPTRAGSMSRMNGIEYLTEITGEPVIGFCQTNDSRGSILVQTTTSLYQFTSEEFFGEAAYVPVLSTSAILEDETMPIAIIVDQRASGVAGGAMANNTNYQTAPLSAIHTQQNADGTAAAFASLAANQITLQAGTYRIWGWSKAAIATLSSRVRARLYNVTAAAAAWSGAANEASDEGAGVVASKNIKLEFSGVLTIGGTTVFEIQHKASATPTTCTFGTASGDAEKEIYRMVQIIKTN